MWPDECIVTFILRGWLSFRDIVNLYAACTDTLEQQAMQAMLVKHYTCSRNSLYGHNLERLVDDLLWIQQRNIKVDDDFVTVDLSFPSSLDGLKSLVARGLSFPIVKKLTISSGDLVAFEEVSKVFPAVKILGGRDKRWTWWVSVIGQLSNVESLQMDGELVINSSALSFMSASPRFLALRSSLRHLSFSESGQHSLKFLSMLTGLESLDMSSGGTTTETELVSALANLRNLRSLTVHRKLTTESVVNLVPHLPNLRSLEIGNMTMESLVFALRSCPLMESACNLEFSMKPSPKEQRAVNVEVCGFPERLEDVFATLRGQRKLIGSLTIRNVYAERLVALLTLLLEKNFGGAIEHISAEVATKDQLATLSRAICCARGLLSLKVSVCNDASSNGENASPAPILPDDWLRFIDSIGPSLLEFRFSSDCANDFSQGHVARLLARSPAIRKISLIRVGEWNSDLLAILANANRHWQEIDLWGANFVNHNGLLTVLSMRSCRVSLEGKRVHPVSTRRSIVV
eukprot:gene25717-31056_t